MRIDWLTVVLAAVGVLVSAYLGVVKLGGGSALMCQAGGGCDIVQASRYATILGVPTALWGTAFYVAVGVLGALGFSPPRWQWTLTLAVAGATFSLYLTFVSLFVIGAACVYCLASTVVALLLVGAILWRRPRSAGRRTPLRWSRVMIQGGAAVVVTIAVAAGIFASYPGGMAGYQSALAQHLARTNAVMYGVYW
ncbi:MAG: vitamin K epoxide reductase family protein [Candidatus Rokuibacteriota bacterium]